MTALPLAGYRVLELAHLVAGPACGMYLADMGADVVKIEQPGGGDASRTTYGTLLGGESAVFLTVNRTPVRFTMTPGGVRTPAPALGEHTEAVLTDSGLTADEITELREAGVIA